MKSSLPRRSNLLEMKGGQRIAAGEGVSLAKEARDDTLERPSISSVPRSSRLTDNMENFSHTDFGEFEKEAGTRQNIKPAVA